MWLTDVLDCFAIARNDGRAQVTLAMTGRCIDGVVRQADVVVDCFAHAGDDIRTSDWIASRFRALTLAMTRVVVTMAWLTDVASGRVTGLLRWRSQ